MVNQLHQALISDIYIAPAHIILSWDDRELYRCHTNSLSAAKQSAYSERMAFFEKITNNNLEPVAVLLCPFGSFLIGAYKVIKSKGTTELYKLCIFRGNEKISKSRISYPFRNSFAIELDELAYHVSRLSSYQDRAIPKANPFKVGDVLYNLWGYEQTNCTFFKVLSITPRQVTLVMIENESLINDMTGRVIPLPEKKCGEPFTRKVRIDSVDIGGSYGSASKLGHTVKYGVTIYDSVAVTCYA